jgi:hypothetical protein
MAMGWGAFTAVILAVYLLQGWIVYRVLKRCGANMKLFWGLIGLALLWHFFGGIVVTPLRGFGSIGWQCVSLLGALLSPPLLFFVPLFFVAIRRRAA